MHVYQFIDAKLPKVYERLLVVVQNPRIPEPADQSTGEDRILEADVAVFLSLEKTQQSPEMILQNHFTLLRKGSELVLRYADTGTAFPHVADELREPINEQFLVVVKDVLSDLVRSHFPEKADLL